MLILDHVQYTYPSTKQSFNFNIKFPDTGITALLGANGAGKSTLIRLMALLNNADHGTILFNNRKITSDALPENFYQEVGVVLQDPATMLFNTTVYDELAYGPNQLMPSEKVIQLVNEIATEFKITNLLTQTPASLSGGQKKLVSIACIVINKPSLLILDEPFDGLSVANINHLKNILVKRSVTTKIIIAHHTLASIIDMIDDAIIIEDHQNGDLITGKEQLINLNDRY
jgi:cobalt/nickel transport system ATP-binding protein